MTQTFISHINVFLGQLSAWLLDMNRITGAWIVRGYILSETTTMLVSSIYLFIP
jgi:hypothetical protein